jgi:hypothetical protein
MKRIVLIAGFESFNGNLYRQAAEMATARCEEVEVIFEERSHLSKVLMKTEISSHKNQSSREAIIRSISDW